MYLYILRAHRHEALTHSGVGNLKIGGQEKAYWSVCVLGGGGATLKNDPFCNCL